MCFNSKQKNAGVTALEEVMMGMKSTIMLGLVVLLAGCGEDKEAANHLSSQCQAAYEAYLKQLEALLPEAVKQTTAATCMSVEEAKKVTRQMYAGMSDEECQQALP